MKLRTIIPMTNTFTARRRNCHFIHSLHPGVDQSVETPRLPRYTHLRIRRRRRRRRRNLFSHYATTVKITLGVVPPADDGGRSQVRIVGMQICQQLSFHVISNLMKRKVCVLLLIHSTAFSSICPGCNIKNVHW